MKLTPYDKGVLILFIAIIAITIAIYVIYGEDIKAWRNTPLTEATIQDLGMVGIVLISIFRIWTMKK